MAEPMEGIEHTNNGPQSDPINLPSPQIWNVREPVFPRIGSAIPGGYQDSIRLGPEKTAIVIDNGLCCVLITPQPFL